jgi:amino acid transporter
VVALVLSLAIIAALYLLVNIALLSGLGLKGLTESKGRGSGSHGAHVRAGRPNRAGLFVGAATLTSINATMIVGARTNYAMARDWPVLRFMGGWHASRGTPVAAFLIQGAIALALVAFGALQHDGFEAMVEFTAPVFWSFLMLVGIALFVLRAARWQRRASVPRPAVSADADRILRGLRMACVLQHRVRREQECSARVAAGDGGRRRRDALPAPR